MFKKEDFWNKCLEYLKGILGESTIEKWFTPVNVSLKEDASEESPVYYILIEVPNEEFCNAFADRFQATLKDAFNKCLSNNRFHVNIRPIYSRNSDNIYKDDEHRIHINRYHSNLNKNFTFDTFITSECNRAVVGLAKTIVARPGQPPHNVFFLYGASGVGKTHICQAIGNMVDSMYPEKRVCYVPCSEFVKQYTASAVLTKDRPKFIRYYQMVDILIIDDIQGLVNKEATQIAFFEIFNHLKDLNKQIILTCDMPISELKGMSERIQTRIQSSVMLKMERPDISLRREMLKRNLASMGITLGEEYSEYIVANANKNLREIEGICNTLGILSQSSKIDLTITREVVSSSVEIVQEIPSDISIERIHEVVSSVFDIEKDKLLEKKRTADRTLPRQVIMYLAGVYTGYSLQSIASYFNLKTHSTIIHGKKTIADIIDVDKDLRNKIDEIKSKLVN